MSTPEFRSLPGFNRSCEPLKTDSIDSGQALAHVSRRGFLATLAAGALTAAFSAQSAAAQAGSRPPMTDVLNFILNLEYLEANFYLYATRGHGLAPNETGDGPAPANAPINIEFDTDTNAVLNALAQDEMNHVILLRTAITSLGGSPIPQPAINYAAMGRITTQAQFLAAAQHFIALGNSAYTGSAQFLSSNPNVLTTIAQILGAKGQHAGMVNSLCIAQRVAERTLDVQDVAPEKTSCFTVTPGTSLSPARTASEVLGVAYGTSRSATAAPAPGTGLGGFFPQGANGNIRTT